MFGWEFPPHISGGLGTACKGIVSGFSKFKDKKIIFVVPKLWGDEKEPKTSFVGANVMFDKLNKPILEKTINERQIRIVKNKFTTIEISSILSPYLMDGQLENILKKYNLTKDQVYFNNKGVLCYQKEDKEEIINVEYEEILKQKIQTNFEFTGKYTSSLMQEVDMYAKMAAYIAKEQDFDVIHAHDWLTYKAGIAAKKATGKPLVIHVHATEYDRSPNGNVNPYVFEIEKMGMKEADAIITVSNLTKDIVEKKYNIDAHKIFTVYNAVDFKTDDKIYQKNKDEKLVTFLGRITHQKGPEYFVKAAKKIIERMPNVRFVMAGGGDMYYQMVSLVAKEGISTRFHFTDFLNPEGVRHLLAISDVYVMPSVSEPFGITPLEAIKSGVPVVISNQSGVGEILEHAFKVDYWDVDALADSIYGLVKYPSLSEHLKKYSAQELDNLKWVKCAKDICRVYDFAIYKR